MDASPHRDASVDDLLAWCRQSPTDPSRWRRLADALLKAGNIEGAQVAAERLLALAPSDREGLSIAGRVDVLRGAFDDARLKSAWLVERFPQQADGPRLRFLAEFAARDVAAAEQACRAILAIEPSDEQAAARLGQLLQARGAWREAKEAFADIACRPTSQRRSLWRLKAACVCPTVFDDVQAIAVYRAELLAALDVSIGDPRPFTLDEWLSWELCPPFNLLFHGVDEPPTRERFAKLAARALPDEWRRLPAADVDRANGGKPTSKPRIGFVVTEGHEAAFARSIGGIVERLVRPIGGSRPVDQSAAEIAVVGMPGSVGAKLVSLGMPGDLPFLGLPGDFPSAVAALRQAAFDVLYHWEVGTDSTNYLLAFVRAAPVQVTSWGVQCTTGSPAIDAYLSPAAFERGDAASDYTERLVLLAETASWQPRSKEGDRPMSPSKGADDAAVDRKHRYVCPHQLGKFHPAFDAVLRGILERDPAGILAITADASHPDAVELAARWRRTLGPVFDRVEWIGRLAGDAYWDVLRTADVVLDPFPFGGVNTTYDAIAAGKPPVTLPGRFQRSRATAGLLALAGVTDTVATDEADYVRLAVDLAGDRRRQREHAERLALGSVKLFDNAGEANQLLDALLELHEQRITQSA